MAEAELILQARTQESLIPGAYEGAGVLRPPAAAGSSCAPGRNEADEQATAT